MRPQLKPVTLTPSDILNELIVDSLGNVLGVNHEVIASSLPFDGNHILAVDAGRRPILVSYDGRDGGRALLAGLGVIEGLMQNRALLYRLYPALFTRSDGSGAIFAMEDVRLVILAPAPPPGAAYLRRTLPGLRVHTFRTLEINGEIGLLVEPSPPGAATPAPDADAPTETPETVFRSGRPVLSDEEEDYFREP